MAYFENAKSSWAHPNFWSHDKHMMGNRLEHNTSCRSEKWEITCSSTPLFHQFWWLVNNVNNLSYKFHGNFKLEFQTWILSPVCLQVSTHGYSQNQILVWKYPSLTQVAKLTGHSYRVLYLVSISCVYLHYVCPQTLVSTVAGSQQRVKTEGENNSLKKLLEKNVSSCF